MLQLKNVYKSYKDGKFNQIALDGINLKFRKNEFVTILGPSGSGKSSCLNIISGIERYDKGDLIINNKSTKNFNDRDWVNYRKSVVGFISKDFGLIKYLSILDNVKINISYNDKNKKQLKDKALEALERVGLKEELYKRVDELSKAEIYKAMIARAIVSDKSIIVADNPIEKLDIKSKEEIMNILKDLSKDKLVIVAMDEEEIAARFSTRIIEFREGEVISDSNPYREELDTENFDLIKTKLNIFTMFKLALKNISRKKLRVFLKMIIWSVVIMGISLIMAFYNGLQDGIYNYENETLIKYPIVISKTSISMSKEDIKGRIKDYKFSNLNNKKYTDENIIYPYNSKKDTITHENKITREYIDYIKNIDSSLISAISYNSNININILKKGDNGKISRLDTSHINFMSYPNGDKNSNYLKEKYDLLYGYYPTNKEDIVLVVDEYNRVDSTILKELGLDIDNESIDFDEIIGKEFKIVLNNDFYKQKGDYFLINSSEDDFKKLYNNKNSITISITGILRAKEDNEFPLLSRSIAYNDDLYNSYIENCKNSDIVKFQQKVDYNVITGQYFSDEKYFDTEDLNTYNSIEELNKTQMLNLLGTNLDIDSITIYPKNFAFKKDILKYLDNYNASKNDDDLIMYKDTSEMMNLPIYIINNINVILSVFAAVLIIILFIMININAHVSAGRGKDEIKILSILGASKADIINLFNIQSCIIGMSSGILGVLLARLALIFIEITFKDILDFSNVVSNLNLTNSLIIIFINTIITSIIGFIPTYRIVNKYKLKK